MSCRTLILTMILHYAQKPKSQVKSTAQFDIVKSLLFEKSQLYSSFSINMGLLLKCVLLVLLQCFIDVCLMVFVIVLFCSVSCSNCLFIALLLSMFPLDFTIDRFYVCFRMFCLDPYFYTVCLYCYLFFTRYFLDYFVWKVFIYAVFP